MALDDFEFGKIWLHFPPPVTQRLLLCGAISLLKCQLENCLRDGAVPGKIYQNRPPLACARWHNNLALDDIECSHTFLFV